MGRGRVNAIIPRGQLARASRVVAFFFLVGSRGNGCEEGSWSLLFVSSRGNGGLVFLVCFIGASCFGRGGLGELQCGSRRTDGRTDRRCVFLRSL